MLRANLLPILGCQLFDLLQEKLQAGASTFHARPGIFLRRSPQAKDIAEVWPFNADGTVVHITSRAS